MYKDWATVYHTIVHNIEELEAASIGLELCRHWMNTDSLLPILEHLSTATPTTIPTTMQSIRKPRLKILSNVQKSNNQDKHLGFSLLKNPFPLLCLFFIKIKTDLCRSIILYPQFWNSKRPPKCNLLSFVQTYLKRKPDLNCHKSI